MPATIHGSGLFAGPLTQVVVVVVVDAGVDIGGFVATGSGPVRISPDQLTLMRDANGKAVRTKEKLQELPEHLHGTVFET
ncbi:hypothetical protein [Gemmobacter sp. 24YEA27]|uniref:hypothetical protein n=1 Tax=Gemmobacter sp. 24YEA27 TaxID=3040672 RepID=UPI0024B3BF1A|nr:hypothetical protein [Gemmobacter sp. 24YEA27]